MKKNEIKKLSVCEIGTLYLLQLHAENGLLETTSRELPELLRVSAKTGLKLINGLEKAGFLKTNRFYGAAGKLKIFIGNAVKFTTFSPYIAVNSTSFPKRKESAVCIAPRGAELNKITSKNIAKQTQIPPSFPLNKPLINPNLTNNKIKTTKNITHASANNNNLLFELKKPSFPCFDGAGIFTEIIIDFFNYRKKDLKKPIKTQRGLDRLISRLKSIAGANLGLAKAICEQSKDHEWQDIFPLKDNNYIQKPVIDTNEQETKRKQFLQKILGGAK